MRKIGLLAATGFLAVGGAAFASGDDVINVPTFTLGGGESISFDFVLEPNNKVITGFLFEGFFDDLADGGSWGSDLRMEIFGPNGFVYSIGGFDTPSDDVWDFDGGGSDEDGFYTHDGTDRFIDNPMAKGDITIRFTNDFSVGDPMEWSDVKITFLKIPAPGALALLGVAGMVGARRRRR